ncbi:MAG: flagellar basal body rod protein FlgC [Candidatus Hydrogenedentota bacterium]
MEIAAVGPSPRDIAVSGLHAQRTRMNVISNNIANAFTTRTETGAPYRRQEAVFRASQPLPSADLRKFGVNVPRIQADQSALRRVYEPGHPDANEEGYVEYPNVDVAVEMVNLVSAQRAYEANIAVIASSGEMRNAAMEIIRG